MALLAWLCAAQIKNIPLNVPWLQEKAQEVSEKFKTNYRISEHQMAELKKCRQRYISFMTSGGKSNDISLQIFFE